METQDVMAQEGRRIVDSARRRGVVLRLLGGLAVHEYCAGFAPCRRDHLDLDVAGFRRQTRPVIEVVGELGYEERIHVRVATGARQAQFVRDCVHGDGVRAHDEDHVDVFFDRFRLDHAIDLRERLALHPYAVPLTDTLAMKLQMHDPEARDVRDVLMLLATVSGEGVSASDVDPDYLGALCARDWGLFYDVSRNLQRLGEALPDAGLGRTERKTVAQLLARLTGAIDAAPKTAAWRLRARVGTRLRWWEVVEEQEGVTS
jgi:hypothetical protein